MTRRLWVEGAFALALTAPRSGLSRELDMPHVVLVGDSVFDNGAYVGGDPDVLGQLQAAMGARGRATLAAVDGAVVASIPGQLRIIPTDATHIAISVGGNDVLRQAAVLTSTVHSMGDALSRLGTIASEFRTSYGSMLDSVLRRGLPTAVCTIYDPRFPEPDRRRIASAALSAFNDAITREAFSRGLTLLDLRLICDEDSDFANPIEPSVSGGFKIARSVVAFADLDPTVGRVSRVIAG